MVRVKNQPKKQNPVVKNAFHDFSYKYKKFEEGPRKVFYNLFRFNHEKEPWQRVRDNQPRYSGTIKYNLNRKERVARGVTTREDRDFLKAKRQYALDLQKKAANKKRLEAGEFTDAERKRIDDNRIEASLRRSAGRVRADDNRLEASRRRDNAGGRRVWNPYTKEYKFVPN